MPDDSITTPSEAWQTVKRHHVCCHLAADKRNFRVQRRGGNEEIDVIPFSHLTNHIQSLILALPIVQQCGRWFPSNFDSLLFGRTELTRTYKVASVKINAVTAATG